MKYIRTKDNKIWLLHEDLFTKGVWWLETKEKVLQISCVPSDLGKVADTIEELCDEICETFELVNQGAFDDFMKDKPLYITKHFEKPIVQKYEILKDYPREKLIKEFKQKDNELGIKTIIYGAIWTDKGLIYVAKMDEQGELELL